MDLNYIFKQLQQIRHITNGLLFSIECSAGYTKTDKKAVLSHIKTARCALYMDALKNFGSPWLRPLLLFPKLLMGFCCNRSYESAWKIWSS